MSSLNELFTDIADAIRSRNGTEDKILATDFPDEISKLDTVKGEEIAIIPSTVKQVYTPSTGYNAITRVDVQEVTNTIDENIIPENIKKDVSILGVTGTLEEGAGGGSVEGAKLFVSVEEMNADTDIEDGDMAIVYADEITSATASSSFGTLRFPETVTLDTAITSGSSAYINSEDGTRLAQISLSATYFYVRDYITYNYIIRYNSTDGINYAMQTGSTEYELSEPGIFYGTWKDEYGKFIQTGGKALKGLYQAKPVTHTNLMLPIPFSNLNRTRPNYTVIDPVYDEAKVIDVDKLAAAINAGFNWAETSASYTSYAYVYWDTSDRLRVVVLNGTNNLIPLRAYDTGSTWSVGAGGYETTTAFRYYWVINVNVSGESDYAVSGYSRYTASYTSLSSYYYYTYPYVSAATVPIAFMSGGSSGGKLYPISSSSSLNGKLYVEYIESSTRNTVEITGYTPGKYAVETLYCPAPTQFTVSGGNEVLPGKIALGKNGEVVGTEELYDNIADNALVSHYLKLPDDVPLYKYTGDSNYLTFLKKGDATDAIVRTSNRVIPEITTVGTTTEVTYSNGYQYFKVFEDDGTYYDAVIYRVKYDGTDVKSYRIQNVCANTTSASSYCKLFAASDTHVYVWNNPRNTTTMTVINFSGATPTSRNVTLPSTGYIEKISIPSDNTMYFVLHSSSTAKLYSISGTSTSCTLIKSISSVYSSGYYSGAGKYAFVKMSSGPYNVYDCSTGSLLSSFTVDTTKYPTSFDRIYMKQFGTKLYCYMLEASSGKYATFYYDLNTYTVTYINYDKQGMFVNSNAKLYYVTSDMIYLVNQSNFSLTPYLAGNSKTLLNVSVSSSSDGDYYIRNISETDGIVEVTHMTTSYISSESRYTLAAMDISSTKVAVGTSADYDYMLWSYRDSEDAIVLVDNTNKYENTITPEEYNTAVDTASAILGEEVNE